MEKERVFTIHRCVVIVFGFLQIKKKQMIDNVKNRVKVSGRIEKNIFSMEKRNYSENKTNVVNEQSCDLLAFWLCDYGA